MRVSFLIDGFNLYHSIRAAERVTSLRPLRWLDLHALCATLISSGLGPGARLEGVYYFSALAHHLQRPDVVRRMFPSVGLRVAFPHDRYNKDLGRRVDGRFRISPRLLAASQFPDPYVLKSGRIVLNQAGSARNQLTSSGRVTIRVHHPPAERHGPAPRPVQEHTQVLAHGAGRVGRVPEGEEVVGLRRHGTRTRSSSRGRRNALFSQAPAFTHEQNPVPGG
jgi:hypothetical protein